MAWFADYVYRMNECAGSISTNNACRLQEFELLRLATVPAKGYVSPTATGPILLAFRNRLSTRWIIIYYTIIPVSWMAGGRLGGNWALVSMVRLELDKKLGNDMPRIGYLESQTFYASRSYMQHAAWQTSGRRSPKKRNSHLFPVTKKVSTGSSDRVAAPWNISQGHLHAAGQILDESTHKTTVGWQ